METMILMVLLIFCVFQEPKIILYYFEKSAETYLTALATGKELNVASHEVAEKTAQEWSNYPSDMGRAHLDQIRLILDKEEPDYQN